MSATQLIESAKRSDRNAIETFRAYNRIQLKKIDDIENITLSSDSDDTTINGRSQTEITKTVNPLNEILQIFDYVN